MSVAFLLDTVFFVLHLDAWLSLRFILMYVFLFIVFRHLIFSGTAGLAAGHTCTFPLTYEGTAYYECTPVDWNSCSAPHSTSLACATMALLAGALVVWAHSRSLLRSTCAASSTYTVAGWSIYCRCNVGDRETGQKCNIIIVGNVKSCRVSIGNCFNWCQNFQCRLG